MSLAVVITVCRGRESNLAVVLDELKHLEPEIRVMVVVDGPPLSGAWVAKAAVPGIEYAVTPKHQPGMEQPRNLGVAAAVTMWPDVTHIWFLDSDVVPDPQAPAAIADFLQNGPQDALVIGPYDWLPAGCRPSAAGDLHWLAQARACHSDVRWAMFENDGSGPYRNDLSKGLAAFGGNLVWPVSEFRRVGGFWNELHHGRCEDGELGARAVAMDVPIYLLPAARAYHLDHTVDMAQKIARNERDVPMLNARHPWLQGHGLFMVDRDGKAFDVRCDCGAVVQTGLWWDHIAEHRG